MSEKTTIQVKFTNPPKQTGWSGSVKTADGRLFGVKEDQLSKFLPDHEYEVEYKTRDHNGRTYHDIIGGPIGEGAAATNGNGHATPAPATGSGVVYANGRSPEVQARIERQHSQEMALRYFAIRGLATDDMEVVSAMTDYFQSDIGSAPRAIGAAPSPFAALAPATAGNATPLSFDV